jgi:hypothetical protein
VHEKLRNVIEHKRWYKRDGTPNIQEHCTPNESKKCELGFVKALHHIICVAAFIRRWHRLTVFHIEQWLYEPSKTFEALDEQLVHY